MYQKNRTPAKWILFVFLLVFFAASVLTRFAQLGFLSYLNPLSILTGYVTSILDYLPPLPIHILLIMLFTLLPLIGFFLGERPASRLMMMLPHIVLLIATCAISFIHLVIFLAEKAGDLLLVTTISALLAIAQSVVVLILINLWQPKRG